MAGQSQPTPNTGTEAQQLTLDFEDGKFVSDHEDKKEWVATAVRIAERRATTRNVVSIILVVAFVSSFPVYALALYCLPDMKQEVMTGFTQWLAVTGSLAGAAVGVGAVTGGKDS